jgi:glycosyltransferase involved in cell wall biosynthesis
VRVALVSYYYPEYTLCLANALRAQGERILLVVPSHNLHSVRDMLQPEVETLVFPSRRLRDPLHAFEVRKIVSAIYTWQADVLHVQQGHLWFNLLGLPWLNDLPLVTTVHDVTSHDGDGYARRTPQWVWDIAFRRAKRLIVHGRILGTHLAKLHAIPADHIHVIPHGEFSIYSRWACPTQTAEHTILFFGRIWPYKGLKYLIEAEPRIAAQVPSVKIVIAGEGENLAPYERMMAHRERFEIHNDYIPVEEVAGLFQRAALVALPYTEASQSGVIPIAYAFGKPVVATHVGGIPDMVEDGETGYLVPPHDVPKLAEAITSLLKDGALRQRMGERARRKALTCLSWDTIAAKTREVYRAVTTA